MKRNNPDCYKCEHRRDLPGDAHSRCNHPILFKNADDSFIGFIDRFFSADGEIKVINALVKFRIKGDDHGIKSGWFNWPFNFDPIWLMNCNGFLEKKKNN